MQIKETIERECCQSQDRKPYHGLIVTTSGMTAKGGFRSILDLEKVIFARSSQAMLS